MVSQKQASSMLYHQKYSYGILSPHITRNAELTSLCNFQLFYKCSKL